MIQVGLDDQLHPDEVVYSQHGGGERCDWGEVTSSDGFRPDVYVAQGSHASYIRPGHYDDPDPDDDANGDGTIDTPLLEDITDPPGWIEWPGRWGDSGNNSPLGPLFHGPAVERHPV